MNIRAIGLTMNGFTKNTVMGLAVTALACGGSETTATSGSSGAAVATTDPAATTSGAVQTATGPATSSTAATLTGEDTSTGEGTTTGEDTTSGEQPTSTGVSETSSTGNGVQDCLDPAVLAGLAAHLQEIDTSNDLLAGHPSQLEATLFWSAPGLPSPPANAALFAGPLVMVCSGPTLYDAYCADGVCSQLECTGEGAGWIFHGSLSAAVNSADWQFDSVDINVRWLDAAAGVDFEIASVSQGPGGADMAMTGTGTMVTSNVVLHEEYPAMLPGGTVVLDYSHDPGGYAGEVTQGATTLATVNAVGLLEPAAGC